MIKTDKELSVSVEYGDTDKTQTDKESLVKTNTNIITEKKETFKNLCDKLRNKFMIGNIYLFLDLDINKYVIINYNSSDKFDTMKMFDKQSITHLIKSICNTRIKSNEVEFFEFSKEKIGMIINSVQGVKKSFDKNRTEFFIDTDYIPTLNLFKRTELLKYNVDTQIEYKELETILKERFKRLYILLKNNIGNDNYIKWFLNWVSMEMNNPEDIKTTFIIIGEQGSGKSVLVEEIFKENIYHFSNVSVLDNKTIKDNFNDIYNYKSFIIMNEVSTMDLKENNQIAQDLKRLITDGSYINRGMFKSGVEKKITFNMGFTTNKNVPVQIENGDRRFSVFGRGKKLLELEEITEDFDNFINEVKKEIRDFLFILKTLNFDKSVSIQPIETELKTKIIEQSNKKEDLMKSYFNTKNYESLESLLKGFEFHNEEVFFYKLSKMFEVGIFTNDILLEIYTNVYDIEITDFNEKSISKKAGSFWSKILHKPLKSQIKIGGINYNYKVFNEEDLESKKEKLKEIIIGKKEVPTTYEKIKQDTLIDNQQSLKVSNTTKKEPQKPLKYQLKKSSDLGLELDENGKEIFPF